MEVKNYQQIKDYQKWAMEQPKGWSGACDVWIGAWKFYDVSELVRIKSLYENEVERVQELLKANAKMRLLLSNSGIENED